MSKDKTWFFAKNKRCFASGSPTLDQDTTIKLVPILLFISSVFFFGFLQNPSTADATPSLAQSIQQFQKNLESSITKEIQSMDNITNDTNCTNSISVQTQTNNNGQTSSTTKNTCNNKSFFSASSINPSANKNLSGAIVSTEYNLETGKINSSIFGNWSLQTTNNSQIDFNTTFIKQPLDLFSNQPESSQTAKKPSVENNKTEYNLSNFRVTSVMQQDSDITYKGTIDAIVKEDISSGINNTATTNTFKDVDTSVSILGGQTLVINFDKQSSLFNEFRGIPLVGVVLQ